MKYIYLIQSLEDGYYKIGISKNPSKRVQQLNTGNASQLKLIAVFQSEYYSKIETAMQNRYFHLRKEGEWFNLSIEEEVNFVKNCKNIEENLMLLKKNGNIFI